MFSKRTPRKASRKIVPRSGGRLSSLDSSRRQQPRSETVSSFTALPGGFADRHRCILRYTQKGLLSSSSSATQQVWAANDVYDPDYTGSGVQPNGYDQLVTMYNRWRVVGSRARVTCVTVSAALPMLCSFGARKGAVTGTVSDDASRSRHEVKWVNSGVSNTVFDQKYTTLQVMGISESQFGDVEYSGTISAGPAHEWYWALRAESFDGSTTCTVYYMCTIDYMVEFYDLLDNTLSLSLSVAKEEKKKESVEPRSTPASIDSSRGVIKMGAGVDRDPAEYEFVELRKLRPVQQRQPGAGHQ